MPILYNNTMCLSYNELISGGILSTSNYKLSVHRGKLQVLRRACRGTEALVCYDSMPPELKAKIQMVYGTNVREVAAKNPLKELLEYDVEARDFFATYKYAETGKHIAADKQKVYVANASALRAIIKLMNDKKSYRKALGGTGLSNSFWNNVIEALKAFQGEWGWKLPYTERNLRERLSDFKKDGYASIISLKDNNQNALATKESEQKSTLRQILRHPNNFDDVQVAYMYNELAKLRNWKPISRSTVANRRIEWNLTTIGQRRGEKIFDNTIAMQVKRKNAGYPMLHWSLDGWEVELLYQQTTTNKDGNSVTTYHNRLTAVIIMDTFNQYPIGYAIGDRENADLIKQAMRNALRHTAELFGSIYRPTQIQSDNFAIKELTPMMESVAKYFIPAKVGNAKAKPIESKFARINRKYCQLQPNWSGFNITASPENQPNTEYRNKIRHSFPNKLGCYEQIVGIIEAERAERKEAFLAKWQELPQEYKSSWTTAQYLYNVGETTGYTNQLQGDGITITINRQPYQYDNFDIEFRKNAHINWVVKYDPADMSLALAHSLDGSLRFLLEEKYIQPMALVERKPGDSEQLQAVFNFNKNLKAAIVEEMQEDAAVVDSLFGTHPELSDTLAKMQLVDNLGQHKIHRQNQKLQQSAKKLLEKQTQKLIKEEEKETAINREAYIASKIDINDYL